MLCDDLGVGWEDEEEAQEGKDLCIHTAISSVQSLSRVRLLATP